MNRLRNAWRTLFDIRPGEYRRTVFMALYLLFVLFAYYILKAASESMFLNKFDIDKLPTLYIYMAIFGGMLAYVYSKVAARTSLSHAVFWTLLLSDVCLVLMWFPLRARQSTIVYVFAVWVRLFSVVTVTQGWVVASNLFNPREAKRVYGLLGMGMIVGAVLGGEFAAQTAKRFGTDNLLFASAVLVGFAYGAFLVASAGRRHDLARAKGADGEDADFSFKDVARDIGTSRHLQALIGIMTVQFIVDTFIDYQFKYMAKTAFHGDALTAFFGRFYGRYLNITEVVLQLFFTTAIIRRLGVGGTLQVMPVSLALASIFTFVSPSVLSASLARLTEASTRYTLTRTANELFYMPLTPELRNRIKAFIDIFVDRAARGIAGFALMAFAAMNFGVRGVAVVTIVITVPWILLTVFAHRQYVKTIRGRIEARRLDVESARVRVEDRDTVRMLETTAAGENARQAAYALQLLDEAEKYNIRPLLARLTASPLPDVRAKVYTIAARRGVPDLSNQALELLRHQPTGPAAREAARYVISISADNAALAREWLDSGQSDIQEGVIEALADKPDLAAEIVPSSWINDHAASEDWRQRALAARVLGGRGDRGLETLYPLLADPDPRVAASACRAAAALKNREYVLPVAKLLADYRVRGDAIEALASYGPVIVGTLGDLIDDDSLPAAVRSSIPRVLRRIQHQRSVDVLMAASRSDEPAVRGAALKALSRLREACPALNYEDPLLTQRILNEAHHYHELVAAAAAFGEDLRRPHTAVSLLVRTLEERMRQSMERLFRLLGLKYPASEMYWSYQLLAKHDKERHSHAIEYLDNVLDQDVKQILLPTLESPERAVEHGRSRFGIEPQNPESTIRNLLDSGDPWLVACAMAAAAELKLRGVASDIRAAAARSAPDISQVADNALAELA